MTTPQTNFLGIVLRVFTAGGKFLLLLYLARYCSLEDVGIYGLFVATNLVAVYLIGFEFSTYSLREILKRDPADRPEVVWSQARFHSVGYSLVLLALLITASFWGLPSWVGAWFFPVFVGSHISQESNRLLIAVSRPGAAYVVSAGAHGLWVIPAILLGLLDPDFRSLHVVFGCWAAGAGVTAIGSCWYLAKLGLLDRSRSHGSWKLVWEGMRVSWVFFLATLCWRTIDLSDRYFIQFYRGESEVGVYTLYSTIAGMLYDVVYTGFIVVAFPVFVGAYQKGDAPAWNASRRAMLRACVLLPILLVPFFVGGIYLLPQFVQDQSVSEELPAYFILLGSVVIFCLSVMPHASLYAWGRDKSILVAVAVGVIINLALNALLVPRYGILGAAIATVAAVATMAVLKLTFQLRLREKYALQ